VKTSEADIQCLSVQAKREHLSCELDGETVILQVFNGRYYGLNAVGSSVWKLIQKPQTYEAIVTQVRKEYAVDNATCEADVRRLIDEMVRAGLVVVNDE